MQSQLRPAFGTHLFDAELAAAVFGAHLFDAELAAVVFGAHLCDTGPAAAVFGDHLWDAGPAAARQKNWFLAACTDLSISTWRQFWSLQIRARIFAHSHSEESQSLCWPWIRLGP